MSENVDLKLDDIKFNNRFDSLKEKNPTFFTHNIDSSIAQKNIGILEKKILKLKS